MAGLAADRIELGASVPRRRNRFLHWLGSSILRIMGWRIDVVLPNHPKLIVILAPHTSNWDFVVGMAAILKIQARFNFYGKHQVFEPPFGFFFRWLGGMPVDRSAPGGVVEQTTRAFREHEQLIIALAPEGTRSLRTHWKRGFYHMANAAQVPVVCAYLDFRRRLVGVGPVFTPTGDWDRDMKPVFDFYRGIVPKRPEHFAVEELP
jgi:1-acyl-sn-glycerol-3-phosphate acyltransferase